jgi:hypothetical protein
MAVPRSIVEAGERIVASDETTLLSTDTHGPDLVTEQPH